jgi:hypothetical protein
VLAPKVPWWERVQLFGSSSHLGRDLLIIAGVIILFALLFSAITTTVTSWRTSKAYNRALDSALAPVRARPRSGLGQNTHHPPAASPARLYAPNLGCAQ